MSQFLQPSIILLREGTDQSQGIGQLISNITACQAVADIIRTTLGPGGMDKLIYQGTRATISNDGAEILKMLDIVHPAAKCLVDIARSQDIEVGDGTTSVTLIACEILSLMKPFIEDGMHPQTIMTGIREAARMCVERAQELKVGVADLKEVDASKVLLERVAGTALNTTKKIKNPKILLLNVELELKSEKENAEVRIDDPSLYQSIVDAEWKIIYDKLDACVKCGASVILSKLPIGDLATQYFADRGMFCAGRVSEEDLNRVSQATASLVQTTTSDIPESAVGTCDWFEERQVGGERFNFFTGCQYAKTSTFVIRGGSEQFVEEAHRSLHDALMVVKRSKQNMSVVAGGGAIEMELSRYIREHARLIEGKQQLVMLAFASALEVIPRQICDNAGLDSIDIMNILRQKHAQDPEGSVWWGVDINNEGICDNFTSGVWEPYSNKAHSIASAAEAACLILSVDETVRNPKSEQQQGPPGGRAPPGGGAPLSAAMGGKGLQGLAQGGMPGVRSIRGRGGK